LAANPVQLEPIYLPAPVQPRREPESPMGLAVAVSIATFMELLDTSIANVSLPHIAGSLGASQDEATWVLTSYLVANGVVLPLSGWLSTLIGRKRFYMACVAIFTVSSVLCGLAPTLPMLIVFRVLQGLGGGGLAPSEQAILTDAFPPHKRAQVFSIYGLAVVLAPTIGPTLGGWITDNYDWRWIFFINLPVGIVSLFLSARLVHDPPALVAQRWKLLQNLHIDYIGIGLLALGLSALQIVLDKGQEDDWFGSQLITACIAIAAVCLVSAVIYELQHKQPVLDVRLLADRNFGISSLLVFGLGFVLFASTVLVPQYLQELLGYTATDAGLVISPGGATVAILTIFSARLLKRISARALIVTGWLIAVAANWTMAHSFDLEMTYAWAAWMRVFQALGFGLMFVPISTAAYSFLARDKVNQASALYNLARNLGGSIGISLMTTIIARRQQFHHDVLGSQLASSDGSLQQFFNSLTANLRARGFGAGAEQHAQAWLGALLTQQARLLAYLDAFMVIAIVAAVILPFAFFLRDHRQGFKAPTGTH
jgi:MFS transporter, DHA2 family, multidrug resistance protein